MYFSQEAVHRALIDLENVQPFYGITFLVCKQANLPIGDSVPFAISQKETEFLNDYYKPLPESAYFFRVFRPSDKSKFWLEPDYSSTGSQSNRTQKFGSAFIHPKRTNLWGWEEDYLSVLKENLQNDEKVPLYSLMVWLYRDIEWRVEKRSITMVEDIFLQDFKLTQEELELFDLNIPVEYFGNNLWSEERYNWGLIKSFFSIPNPNDAPVDKVITLKNIDISNIGPAENFYMEFNKRLNLITGDNGLGKTFILESLWWALTNTWTGDPLYPNISNRRITSTISYTTEGENGSVEIQTAYYNRLTSNWQRIDEYNKVSLVIYARADGLFAIMDPAANANEEKEGRALVFTKKDIWDGLTGDDNKGSQLKIRRGFSNYLCNGLINDWTNWQQSNDNSFEVLKKVLKKLSPPKLGDLGVLEPGDLIRVPGDSRLMPTIRHPYGEVPVIYASEAVKRILSMAYLIVWTWQEHKLNSYEKSKQPSSNMIFMADEIEAHLHPQWQRSILPALLNMAGELDENLTIQYAISSHSPLVLGSIENLFDSNKDKLFHLNIDNNQRHNGRYAKVELREIDFEKRGTIDSWLTSDIFNLDQPRGSIKSEQVIERAVELQLNKEANRSQVERVTDELRKVLPVHDKFWVRWRAYAYNFDIEV